jgi:hypothetical protein
MKRSPHVHASVASHVVARSSMVDCAATVRGEASRILFENRAVRLTV